MKKINEDKIEKKQNKLLKEIKRLFSKYEEVILYLVMGVLTTLISIIVYFILTKTLLDAKNIIELQIANVISWVIAVTFAYVTNRIYVFKSKTKGKEMYKEIASFASARVFSLLVDMSLMFVLVSLLSFNDMISKILINIIVIVLNYVLSKLIIFKKKA